MSSKQLEALTTECGRLYTDPNLMSAKEMDRALEACYLRPYRGPELVDQVCLLEKGGR
jgi:hypothetical protein